MGDQISQLLRIVQDEIQLCSDLIEHARQKAALLMQGGVDAILESNKSEEIFQAKLRVLESEKARLCEDLGVAFRIRREELTLVKLAQHLDSSCALELRSQAFLFRDIMKRLKSINRRNVRLMEDLIRYSGGILALISNARGFYRPSGLLEPISHMEPRFSQNA